MKIRISPGDSAGRSCNDGTSPATWGLGVEPCLAGPAAACGDDGGDCSEASLDTCARDGVLSTCAWERPTEAGGREGLCHSGVNPSKVWRDTSSNAAVSSCGAGSALARDAAIADAPRGPPCFSMGASGSGVAPTAGASAEAAGGPPGPAPGELATGGINIAVDRSAGASPQYPRTSESRSTSTAIPAAVATATSPKRGHRRRRRANSTGIRDFRRTTYHPGAPATGGPLSRGPRGGAHRGRFG